MRPSETYVGHPLAFAQNSDLEAQREEACAWAQDWVRWKCECYEKPCVVFDIDSTLLEKTAIIPSVVALYNACGELGVTRFIVTARSDAGRAYTMDELGKHGIPPPRHLFMHPQRQPCTNSTEAGRAKRHARERIERKKYVIILNVGDAWHDHRMPGEEIELHRAVGNTQTAVWVDAHTGCAHIKLVHP